MEQIDLNEEINNTLYELIGESLVNGIDVELLAGIHETISMISDLQKENFKFELNSVNYALLDGFYKMEGTKSLSTRDRLTLDSIMDHALIKFIDTYHDDYREKLSNIVESNEDFENYLSHHMELLRTPVNVANLSNVSEECDYPLHPMVDLTPYHIEAEMQEYEKENSNDRI